MCIEIYDIFLCVPATLVAGTPINLQRQIETAD